MNAILSLPFPEVLTPGPDVSDWRPALILGVAMGITSMLVLPYASAMTGKPLVGPVTAKLSLWPS